MYYVVYVIVKDRAGRRSGRFHPVTDILYHSKHRDYLQ